MNESEEQTTEKTILKIIVPNSGAKMGGKFISVSVIEELGDRYVLIEDPDDVSWILPITSKKQWPLINFAVNTALKLCKD